MLGNRLLLVDDDRSVLESLEAVFNLHHFQTTVASTVSEAIQAIAKTQFDILVTDLNIGEPGDGFTVVSALRRVQPDAVALIITGFPAFDNALQAIRQQVDDYVVKPISPPDLLATIQRLQKSRQRHLPLPTKRASEIVRQNKAAIQQRWLARVRQYADRIGRNDLDDASLLNHLPFVIEELCSRVEQSRDTTSEDAKAKAIAHGLLRREQNLDPTFILNEGKELRQEILREVHHNLLKIDMSTLLLDLAVFSESLDEQLKFSMEAHLSGGSFIP